MTSSILKSIFITATAFITAVCIAVIAASYTICYEGIERELEAECRELSDGYAAHGIQYIEMKSGTDGLLFIGGDGEILFGTGSTDTEEISEARNRGVGFCVGEREGRKILYCAVEDSAGNIIRLCADIGSGMSPFFDTLYFTLISLIFSVTAAFFAAFWLSHGIVKPLRDFDIDRPRADSRYPELKPLIDKLNLQRYKISEQMTELRTRANELNSITSNMSEGMIIINANAQLLSCNDSARQILGIVGELPRGLLSVRNTPRFRDAVFSALNGKNGHDSIKTEDKFYSILVTPVKNDFEVQGAVIMIIDDTEKEHRESLRREFTSNISHELKTPLTSISGFAELIRDGIATEDDARRFAANIHKEAARLIVLVGDIIKLSMLDGGELDSDEKIDLLSVCEGVVQRLANVAEAGDISLLAEGERAFIFGNARTVEEMIYNLADNGIKYNNRGGFVRLCVCSENGEAVVTVEDNGIGIPQDKQDRVFERFYRVDKSHSKAIGGTGLGLSIVKHAALRHGAKITLTSELEVGTQITVRFPCAESALKNE